MMATETVQLQLDKPPKVKRRSKKVLTLAEKISVINEYENVLNTRKLAKTYGCGRTQIQNIIRRRHFYLEQRSTNGDPNKMRYKQSAKLMILGAVVFEWIQRTRSQGLHVHDAQILKAGQRVAKLMNNLEFRATQTWLKRLKKLFKIECLDPLPICNPVEANKSLNLLDILLEFRREKEKLPERLPQSYIMYHALEAEDFHRIATDEIVIVNDDNKSQISINDDNTSQTSTILNEMEIERNSKKILPFDGNRTSTGSDEFLTEVEIEDDSQRILSFEVRLSGRKIIAKPKTKDKVFNKDLSAEVTSGEKLLDIVKAEEPAKKESKIPSIASYREALNHLGPIEQFALLKEDIRAVGIINQLEILFAERMASRPT